MTFWNLPTTGPYPTDGRFHNLNFLGHLWPQRTDFLTHTVSPPQRNGLLTPHLTFNTSRTFTTRDTHHGFLPFHNNGTQRGHRTYLTQLKNTFCTRGLFNPHTFWTLLLWTEHTQRFWLTQHNGVGSFLTFHHGVTFHLTREHNTVFSPFNLTNTAFPFLSKHQAGLFFNPQFLLFHKPLFPRHKTLPFPKNNPLKLQSPIKTLLSSSFLSFTSPFKR